MKYCLYILFFTSIFYSQNLNPALIKQLSDLSRDQLKQRYQQNANNNIDSRFQNFAGDSSLTLPFNLLDSINVLNRRLDSIRNIRDDAFFGESYFKNLNVAPNTYGPVPDSYILGSGDVLSITLTGETQLSNEFTIDRSNSIYPENVGKITLGGLIFLEAKKVIKSQFEKSYSTLKGARAKTFIHITVTNQRRIHVSVLGHVKTPRNMILSSLNTVFDAVAVAGGPLKTAALRHVEIKRGSKTFNDDLYGYMLPSLKHTNFRLEDGDVIRISEKKSLVKIEGGVRSPGFFEISDHSNVDEIIDVAGGLQYDASLEYVSIGTTLGDSLILLNFKNAMMLKSYILKENDQIYINSKAITDSSFVKISGSVKYPGYYAFEGQKKLADYIARAGGLKDQTYLKRIDILRKINEKEFSAITVTFDDLATTPIKDGDIIELYNYLDFIEIRKVYILSFAQGLFEFQYYNNSDIYDYISKIGGIKFTEDDSFVEIVRLNQANDNNYATSFTLELNKNYLDYKQNKNNEFLLKPDDIIIIRKAPNVDQFKVVKIFGEVVSEGSYPIINRKERLSKIIERARGFKSSAYVEGIQFYRKITSDFKLKNKIEISPRNFDYSEKRFKSNFQSSIESEYIRIPVDFNEIIDDEESEDNLIITDQDSIVVPQNPFIVLVEGEVNRPSPVIFKGGESVEYYLEQAGGLTEFGDDSRIQVVKANGKNLESGIFSGDDLNAGTVITVPPKVVQDKTNEILTTIFTSLSAIVTTLVLINQL